MSGLEIIGGLLREDAALLAYFRTATGLPGLLSEDQIKGGKLPDDTVLPALLVKEESKVERQPLKRQAKTRTVDRVSVTVRATTHRDQRRVMDLVRDCCAGRTGNIGGSPNVSIGTVGTGPELNGPGDTFERTQDFRVSYDA